LETTESRHSAKLRYLCVKPLEHESDNLTKQDQKAMFCTMNEGRTKQNDHNGTDADELSEYSTCKPKQWASSKVKHTCYSKHILGMGEARHLDTEEY